MSNAVVTTEIRGENRLQDAGGPATASFFQLTPPLETVRALGLERGRATLRRAAR